MTGVDRTEQETEPIRGTQSKGNSLNLLLLEKKLGEKRALDSQSGVTGMNPDCCYQLYILSMSVLSQFSLLRNGVNAVTTQLGLLRSDEVKKVTVPGASVPGTHSAETCC